jgi:hypothetical protein
MWGAADKRSILVGRGNILFGSGRLLPETVPILTSIPGHVTQTNVGPEKAQRGQQESSAVGSTNVD